MTTLNLTIDIPEDAITNLQMLKHTENTRRQDILRSADMTSDTLEGFTVAQNISKALSPLNYIAIESVPFIEWMIRDVCRRIIINHNNEHEASNPYEYVQTLYADDIKRQSTTKDANEARRLLMSFVGQYPRPVNSFELKMDPLYQPQKYLLHVITEYAERLIFYTNIDWTQKPKHTDVLAYIENRHINDYKKDLFG